MTSSTASSFPGNDARGEDDGIAIVEIDRVCAHRAPAESSDEAASPCVPPAMIITSCAVETSPRLLAAIRQAIDWAGSAQEFTRYLDVFAYGPTCREDRLCGLDLPGDAKSSAEAKGVR